MTSRETSFNDIELKFTTQWSKFRKATHPNLYETRVERFAHVLLCTQVYLLIVQDNMVGRNNTLKTLADAFLQALVKGYPDRLHILYSAPVSTIIQFVVNLLLPLMPGRLASKIMMIGQEDVQKKLDEMLLHGDDDLPDFFGGKADHDKYYPEESKCPNRGEGSLKFDYFGMLERLDAAKKEFMANKK